LIKHEGIKSIIKIAQGIKNDVYHVIKENERGINDREVLRNLLTTTPDKSRIVTTLVFTVIRTHEKIIFHPMGQDTHMGLTVSLIENWINPWIQSRGGWKNALREDEKTEEEESDTEIFKEFKKMMKQKKGVKDKMNWSVIMMMIMMMFQVIKGAEGIIVYDCLRPKKGKKYSLVNVEECPEASPISIEEAPEQVRNIYQESDFFS